MKKLLPLLSCCLVVGCGDNSSSERSGRLPSLLPTPAEPSADAAKPAPTEPPVAESSSDDASESPSSLSDAEVERLLKEAVAVDYESAEEREGLLYLSGESEPYSGRIKEMFDSGQVAQLTEFKDGKPDGLRIAWYESGQKTGEGSYKKGKVDGPFTEWHENGQKAAQGTFKEGEEISAKYWNSKGEEVKTRQEAWN